MKVVIESERLFLREFAEGDVDNLFELDSYPEIVRWGNGGNTTNYERIQTQSLPKMMETYNKYDNFGIWAAIEKSSQSFMGWFHFFPATDSKFVVDLNIVADGEIALGYRLIPDFWGKGYATEMSQALVLKGFNDWDVQRVVAWTLLNNHRSIRVMEKVGLKFEREFTYTEVQLPVLSEFERKAVKYGLNREDLKG
jgi:[ribosomal protein S5]-alanine N-acetyltransferase